MSQLSPEEARPSWWRSTPESEAALATEVALVVMAEKNWEALCQAIGETFYDSDWLVEHDRAIQENAWDQGYVASAEDHNITEHCGLRHSANPYLRDGVTNG